MAESSPLDPLKETLAFKGVETYVSGYGTTYAVVAKKDGLSLAVAPKVLVGKVIGVALRLRAEKVSDYADLSKCRSVFNFPELEERTPQHWSTTIFVVIGLAPVSPLTLGKIIESNKIVATLIDAVEGRLASVGVSFGLPKELIYEYARNVVEDAFPSEEKPQPITEFPVHIGEAASAQAYQDALKKYFPEIAD
jgi:hypothetical protein